MLLTRLRSLSPFQANVAAFVLVVLVFVGLRLLQGGAHVVSAPEIEAARGGITLVDKLYLDASEREDHVPSLRRRLVEGFEVSPNSPWWEQFKHSKARSIGMEPPLPRWIAALGIGVLPVSESATNFERASVAASLVVLVSLALLFKLALPYGAWWAAFGCGLLLVIPGFWEAASSAGYGAGGLIASLVFALGFQRLLKGEGGTWLTALGFAMMMGVHPLSLTLVLALFVSVAITHRADFDSPDHGRLALPMVPLTIFAVIALGFGLLFAMWPGLWAYPKGLGPWIVEFGRRTTSAEMPAWMVLVQALTAIPLPLWLLWSLGLAKAYLEKRNGQWWPIVMVLTLGTAGAINGGMFAGGLSLWPLLWIFLVWTALEGAILLYTQVQPAYHRVLLPAVALLMILAGLRGDVLSRGTGVEAIARVPVVLLTALEAEEVSIAEASGALGVVLGHALDVLDIDLDLKPLQEAELVLGWASEPPPSGMELNTALLDESAPFSVWRRMPK